MQSLSRYIGWVLLLLLISGCGEQVKSSSHEAAAAPVLESSSLVFEPDVVDMGTVKEGDEAVAWLRVRNAGDTMQQIVDVQTSCGCSVAEPEVALLMPGDFTRIKVVIDTFAKLDDVKKWVQLTDAQGKSSKAWLTLTVRPNPHMESTSRSIFDGKCAACHFTPAEGKVGGREIYAAVCAMCHGEKGEGAAAPAIVQIGDVDIFNTLISQGTGSQHMPGFATSEGGPLTEKQVSALSKWLSTLDE